MTTTVSATSYKVAMARTATVIVTVTCDCDMFVYRHCLLIYCVYTRYV
jgi:hypothetical protein